MLMTAQSAAPGAVAEGLLLAEVGRSRMAQNDPKQPFRFAAIAPRLLTYERVRGLVISLQMPQFSGLTKPHLRGLLMVRRHIGYSRGLEQAPEGPSGY